MTTRTAHMPAQGFTRRRLSELAGILLGITALLTLIALFSYDKGDPSFNHTSSDIVRNMVGVPGAYMADLLLQTVGVASILVVFAFAAWGWRLLSKHHTRGWWLRISALLVGLVAFSGLVSVVNAPSSWPIATGLGGSIGMLIKFHLGGLISVPVMGIVALLITVLMIPLAFGLRRSEWFAIWSTFVWAGMQAKGVFTLIRDALRGSATVKEPAQEKPKAKAKRRARKAKDDDLIIESPDDKPEKKKKIIEAKKVREENPQAAMELRPKEGDFQMPEMALLAKVSGKKKASQNESSLTQNAKLLESVLDDFGVKGEITRVRPGPVVTLYELEPAPGIKSSRVIGLADDIARSMSAISARIAVIPGRNAIGIELPNSSRETVYLREVFEDKKYQQTETKLPLALGKDIGGDAIIADLAKMPHLLVAGTTGSGKSVAINTMLMSLIYHLPPERCKFIMIDPKMLELSVYDGIPHLLSPVVTEPGKAVVALKWAVKEMENRYRLMSNLGVRNIENYNKRIVEAKKKGEELTRTVQTGFDPETGKPIMEKVPLEMNPLPFIVLVVDEMADLMLVAGKDIEGSIQRLAQMARAAGIHLIMATQRPSVDVITGVIKANFPTRISFSVTSKIDSRTILGEQGAEQLLGQGDMLYMAGGGRITRVHGPFISDKEVEQIVSFLKEQGEPEYDEAITEEDDGGAFDATGLMGEGGSEEDQLYQQAVQVVIQDNKASTSYIQRKLKIGYNRAARIIERMEEEGIVGAANHVGKREVLYGASD